jgi:hypothetical protein
MFTLNFPEMKLTSLLRNRSEQARIIRIFDMQHGMDKRRSMTILTVGNNQQARTTTILDIGIAHAINSLLALF